MVRITPDLVARYSKSVVRKGETQQDFLGRITHLSLEEKSIKVIENLTDCTSVQVCYLYGNQLTRIEGLTSMSQTLTALYLHENKLESMAGLDNLVNLQKLYLNNNCIAHVANLGRMRCLQELYVQSQQLPSGASLTFEPESLMAIGRTLGLLNAGGNNIADPSPLGYLGRVHKLMLANNPLDNEDLLALALSGLTELSSLNISGSPIAKQPKYREHIILMSQNLTELDGKAVTRTERAFLVNFHNQKAMRRLPRDDSTATTAAADERHISTAPVGMEGGAGAVPTLDMGSFDDPRRGGVGGLEQRPSTAAVVGNAHQPMMEGSLTDRPLGAARRSTQFTFEMGPVTTMTAAEFDAAMAAAPSDASTETTASVAANSGTATSSPSSDDAVRAVPPLRRGYSAVDARPGSKGRGTSNARVAAPAMGSRQMGPLTVTRIASAGDLLAGAPPPSRESLMGGRGVASKARTRSPLAGQASEEPAPQQQTRAPRGGMRGGARTSVLSSVNRQSSATSMGAGVRRGQAPAAKRMTLGAYNSQGPRREMTDQEDELPPVNI